MVQMELYCLTVVIPTYTDNDIDQITWIKKKKTKQMTQWYHEHNNGIMIIYIYTLIYH